MNNPCSGCSASTGCPGAYVAQCGGPAGADKSSSASSNPAPTPTHYNGLNHINNNNAAASIFSIGKDGSILPPPPPKGRRRARMLQQQQQQQQQQENSGSGGAGGEKSSSGISAPSSWSSFRRDGVRPGSLSAKILSVITGAWLLAVALMLIVPESQGLLTYLHWIRWPLFRDLTDLKAFRLPHARNIKITTADGVVLGGWHLLPTHRVAAEASRFEDGSKARETFFDEALGRPGTRVVLYFHGNAASRGQYNRIEIIKSLAATMEAHVVAVDYRGFADSTGWPSEEGLGLDARAVWGWVRERTGGNESTSNVYLYGHSLGSSVVLGLANHLSRNAHEGAPAGVILDAPFTNLTTAALHHPSALPFRILPFMRYALLHSMHEHYPSIDLIAEVIHPILILHGHRDRMIPFQLGLELYQAAKLARIRKHPHLLEDLWFSEIPTAAHNDIYAHPQWLHDVHSFMLTMEEEGLVSSRQTGEGEEVGDDECVAG